MADKSKLVKKAVRSDTLKIKKGGPHKTKKGDAKLMRKNKKKDVQQRVDEASMTVAIQGYLSSMKQSPSSGKNKDKKPWYMVHETKNAKEFLRNLLLEAGPDLTKIFREPEKASPSRWSPEEGRVPEDVEEYWKSMPAHQGYQVPEFAKRKFGKEHPEFKGLTPGAAAEKILAKAEEEEVGRAKGAKALGTRTRTHAAARTAGRISKKVSSGLEDFKTALEIRQEDIKQRGGPETSEDRETLQLLDALEKNPGILKSKDFLDGYFTSYPERFVQRVEFALKKSGKSPLRISGGLQSQDRIWRIFTEELPPIIVLQFIEEYLSDPTEIRRADAAHEESALIAGKSGVKGEITGTPAKKYEGETSERIAASEEDVDELADIFNGIKGLSRVELEDAEREITLDSSGDSVNKLLQGLGLDEVESLEIVSEYEPEEVKHALRKAAELEQFTEKEAREKLSPKELNILTSRIIFNPSFLKKAIVLIAKSAEDRYGMRVSPKQIQKMIEDNAIVINKAKILRAPENTEFLSKKEKVLYNLIYRNLNPTSLLKRTRGFGKSSEAIGNPIINYIRNELKRRETKEFKEKEVGAREKVFSQLRQEKEKRLKEPRVSPEKIEKAKGRKAEMSRIMKYPQLARGEKIDLQRRIDDLNKNLSGFEERVSKRESKYEKGLQIYKSMKDRKDPSAGVAKGALRRLRALIAKDKMRANAYKSRIKKLSDELELQTSLAQQAAVEREPAEKKGKPTKREKKIDMVKQMIQATDDEERKSKLKDYLRKLTQKLEESRLTLSVGNLRNLIESEIDELSEIGLIEMLLSPEHGDKEEKIEKKNKNWEKAKPIKSKDFYPKLESVLRGGSNK